MVDFLIEPFARLGSAERHRARLLASLLLSFITFGLLSAVVQSLIVPDFEKTFAAMLMALIVLSLAYLGSRTRLYRLSAALAAVTPALACIAVGVRSPDDRVWYAFMLIAVILTSLFFSVRTAAMVAAAIFVTLCLLPIWVFELRAPARIVPLLALHGVLSPLLLIGAHYQAAIERENQDAFRRMDARIAELQHLEALGRVASRAAHDFNNLIMTIDGNVSLLEQKLPDDEDDAVRDIRTAVERASALSQELLSSARNGNSRKRAFEVENVLRDFQPLLGRIAGPAIRVVVRPGATLTPVEMDPLRFERVLMNLVTNARDAMPKGGDLLIECSEVVLDESYVTAHPNAQPGAHVLISVADTGVGMDATTIERIFEPFFSTKGIDRGTGLGLAIVHDAITEVGGHVTVESAPGHGSTFRAYFPASTAPISKR